MPERFIYEPVFSIKYLFMQICGLCRPKYVNISCHFDVWDESEWIFIKTGFLFLFAPYSLICYKNKQAFHISSHTSNINAYNYSFKEKNTQLWRINIIKVTCIYRSNIFILFYSFNLPMYYETMIRPLFSCSETELLGLGWTYLSVRGSTWFLDAVILSSRRSLYNMISNFNPYFTNV